MSAVRIIRALLVADAALLALVPAAQVMAGTLPQGTALPALAVTEVSVVDAPVVKLGAAVHCTARVQVTAMTASYPAQKLLLAAVRHACRGKAGSIAGCAGVTVHAAGTGPDFNDADTGFYMQSQDFKVGFSEAT